MPNVQIFTGRAHRLFAPVLDEIAARYAQKAECILLVPEQFTLQAERELMERLHLQGLFSIQVLSPSRLSDYVLEAAGGDGRKPLDTSGRHMAIRQALERCEDRLVYYRSTVGRRGFVEKAAALFTDMKRGGLSPEALEAYGEELSEGREKFLDIAVMYAAYEDLLQGRFSDDEDQLRYVASRLSASGILQGQHVFAYGFDTLPEQLMQLFMAMAPLCESLTVALICDAETAADGELYLPVRQGIMRFRMLLEAEGISVSQRQVSVKEPLHAPPAIRHLDETLFAYSFGRYEEPQENVFCAVYQSPFEESIAMARKILGLCAEGTSIERIAVMYPEGNGYGLAVAAALQDAGLPFYTDEKLPSLSHGLIRFLLCALRAVANGYRNEEMLGMLKSGYATLPFEEACILENYAMAQGIDKYRWQKPFSKGEEGLAVTCEGLRLRVMEPLLRLREGLVAARNTQDSLTAVFGLLQDVKAYETLKEEEKALLAEGLMVRANQNSQVWQAVLRLLEQLHALSGGARVPMKYLADRLESGFAAISLASLPPASHMLHVGALGHYLSGEMDAVFLLGLNDGVLLRNADSLFSEEERAQTQEKTGAFLGLTDKSRNLFAKLDVKRAMTLPQRLLFLSYAKTAPDGTALRSMPLLGTVEKRLFSKLPCERVPLEELPLSAPEALAELSVRLRAYADGTGETDGLPSNWIELLGKLLKNSATAEKTMRLLWAAEHRLERAAFPKKDARNLFGGDSLSVSRLEKYAGCPFQHFVTYGLRPERIKPWGVEPIDTGEFYHESLDKFVKLSQQCAEYPHITSGQVDALAEEALAPVIEEAMQGPMGDGARNQAAFEQARRIVHRAARTITEHLAAGEFRVLKTEATFGDAEGMPPIVLVLADGSRVFLRGRIDRVDSYQSGESIYLRVIDYKSSRQDLEAAKTWWGLQLQLLLYLDVCVAAQPLGLPAGAFYFYVADPLVQTPEDVQEVVEKKLRDALQLKGLVLSDVEILKAMDGQESPVALPKMLDKAGTPMAKAKVLELPEMQALLSHARKLAVSLAEGIFSGDVSISPMDTGNQKTCDYCECKDICGFHPDLPGAEVRRLPSMEMKDLRQALQMENGNEKNFQG